MSPEQKYKLLDEITLMERRIASMRDLLMDTTINVNWQLNSLRTDIEQIFGLNNLFAKLRTDKITLARYVFAAIARNKFDLTLLEIAAYMDKDHTTIMHNIKQLPIRLKFLKPHEQVCIDQVVEKYGNLV